MLERARTAGRQKREALLPRLAVGQVGLWLPLAVPLALALLLRVYAIAFGSGLGVLFGDERVAAAQGFDLVANRNLLALRPNGALHYLVNAPLLYVLSLLHNGSANPRLVYNLPLFDAILAGRAVNVAFGLATVVIVYLTARRLSGRQAGFWAALAVAVSPSLVVESHFNATAADLVFWFVLTLYCLVRACQGRQRWWYLALVAATLAFFTKPVGVAAFAAVGLASLWQAGAAIRQTGRLSAGVLAPVLAGVLGVGLLAALRWRWLITLVSAFLFTYEKGTQPVFAWAWLLQHEGLLLALGLAGFGLSRTDARVRWPFMLTGVLYGLGALAFRVFYVRWLLIVVPLAALFAGEAIAGRFRLGVGRAKSALAVALAVVVIGAMTVDAFGLLQNLNQDVRATAWEWIRQNIPPGATLAVETDWLLQDGPAQMYRVKMVNGLTGDPAQYAGANYVILFGEGPDYYNWRPAPAATDARARYPALYSSLVLEKQVYGTLLHIPVRTRIDILRVPGSPVYPAGQPVLGSGWHEVEDEFRWMTERGHVYYYLPGDSAVEGQLSFDAYGWQAPDIIAIRANGEPAGQATIDARDGLRHVASRILLKPGLNDIELVSQTGCERPIVADPTSTDARCISITVGHLAVKPGAP